MLALIEIILFIGLIISVISLLKEMKGEYKVVDDPGYGRRTITGEYFGITCFMAGACIVLFIVFSIPALCTIGDIVEANTATSNQIQLYEEQNSKIEEDIKAQIEAYQQYEQKTFTQVTKDNALQLVQLYPNLKSDELVKKNIELHVNNINKINELKEKVIKVNTAKWWLYFNIGG